MLYLQEMNLKLKYTCTVIHGHVHLKINLQEIRTWMSLKCIIATCSTEVPKMTLQCEFFSHSLNE